MQKAIHGITVAHFYETYREKLKLELLTGEGGLHRLIKEGSINRPSLALTGFFKYFANKRVQVFGAAEMTYMKTLPAETQADIFRQMAFQGNSAVGAGKVIAAVAADQKSIESAFVEKEQRLFFSG